MSGPTIAEVVSENLLEHRAVKAWSQPLHGLPVPSSLKAVLPDHGPDHYLDLLHCVRAALLERSHNPALPAGDVALLWTVVAHCDMIEAHWAQLEAVCTLLPRALVHGDFVLKNLRIRNGRSTPALLVFDWEMAGQGVPASDLAQSVGRCVNPDLNSYCSALQEEFPRVKQRDCLWLARCGSLLRMVDKLYWETLTMQGDSYEFLVNPIRTVGVYEPELTGALRALKWS